MATKILLSTIEHKVLLGIGLCICTLYFINFSDKFIANYNKEMESEQIEKRKIANNEEKVDFGITECFITVPMYEVILGLQFFTIPLLVLLLRKQNFARFLYSLFLTSFILFGYLNWMSYTYSARKINEVFRIEDTTFNTYMLYQSTILEFILFLGISILFILQFALLLRFVLDKLQAKMT